MSPQELAAIETAAIRTACRHRWLPPNEPEACGYPKCGCDPQEIEQRIARAVLAEVVGRVGADERERCAKIIEATKEYDGSDLRHILDRLKFAPAWARNRERDRIIAAIRAGATDA